MTYVSLRGAFVAVAASLLITAAAAQATKPMAPSPDTVIAVVDGVEIRYEELVEAQGQLPAQYQQMPIDAIYEPLLSQLVDRRMLANAAKASGFESDPAYLKRMETARVNILAESWLAKLVEPAVADEKLQARYEEEKKNFKGAEEVHARHILLKTEAEARKILAEIRKGADFGEMAKQHSTGPSGKQGGDLGFFDAKTMVPEFSKVAFAMNAGDVSEPVKTQFGWHIIRVETKRQAEGPSFEQREKELRQGLAQEAVANTLADLRKKSDIKLFKSDGTPLEPKAEAADTAAEKKPEKTE